MRNEHSFDLVLHQGQSKKSTEEVRAIALKCGDVLRVRDRSESKPSFMSGLPVKQCTNILQFVLGQAIRTLARHDQNVNRVVVASEDISTQSEQGKDIERRSELFCRVSNCAHKPLLWRDPSSATSPEF